MLLTTGGRGASRSLPTSTVKRKRRPAARAAFPCVAERAPPCTAPGRLARTSTLPKHRALRMALRRGSGQDGISPSLLSQAAPPDRATVRQFRHGDGCAHRDAYQHLIELKPSCPAQPQVAQWPTCQISENAYARPAGLPADLAVLGIAEFSRALARTSSREKGRLWS
jgi:hypothetical protein